MNLSHAFNGHLEHDGEQACPIVLVWSLSMRSVILCEMIDILAGRYAEFVFDLEKVYDMIYHHRLMETTLMRA